MTKCKNEFAVKLIKAYQKNKSVIGVGHCKFYPTCSNYALETYQKFNFFYATLLVGIRILRCNALAKRRYYPVKLTKEEKKINNYLKQLKIKFNDDFIDYLQSISKENITNEDMYKYIYDYYFLPKHSHFINIPNTDTVYASRFIISKQPISCENKPANKLEFEDYLKITDELYQNKIISKTYQKCDLIETNDFLIPIDSITINSYLSNLNINEGIILINNYPNKIIYQDFEVIEFHNKKIKQLEKLIQGKNKVIIKTNNANILEFLEYIDHSINIYQKVDEINYFYDVNKRLD